MSAVTDPELLRAAQRAYAYCALYENGHKDLCFPFERLSPAERLKWIRIAEEAIAGWMDIPAKRGKLRKVQYGI